MREVSVSGEGFVLVLRVSGYERPSFTSGADANWLRGEAELTLPGSFSGRSDVSLRTEELEAFRDDLAGAVEALEGEATLRHMEDEVGCRITLERGSGEFEAFIRKRVPAVELRIAGARTDQSYLRETVRQLDELVADFPVKGDPTA